MVLMLIVLMCSHRNVYVVVVPLRRTRGLIRGLKSPDEMDLEEVRTITTAVHTEYSAWKEERTYKQKHVPTARNFRQHLPFLIKYQCSTISHRY